MIKDLLNTNRSPLTFKDSLLNTFERSPQKVAVLVSNEFEGVTRNGGIGTYYTALSQSLAADGWYVILLLCHSEQVFQGKSHLPSVQHIFSTYEVEDVLDLQTTHLAILDTLKQDSLSLSFDAESFRCLFFAQALLSAFPNGVVYFEFPIIWGFGLRTIQARQCGLMGHSCLVAVTSHGSFEWLREINRNFVVNNRKWLMRAYHYEQFSCEQADLTCFPSKFLKQKESSYGWKTDRAKLLPYFIPLLRPEISSDESLDIGSGAFKEVSLPDSCNQLIQTLARTGAVPIIFFGRLEDRKGLLTFVRALQKLHSALTQPVHIIFMGKIVNLQSPRWKHLDSREYIEQHLQGNDSRFISHTILNDLSSQEATRFITALDSPIVCLTSSQENFPNAALEMGQLPVSLVVSKTGGFEETLSLVNRSDGVYWFQPDRSTDLARALHHALVNYPETPSVAAYEALVDTNRRTLEQRLTYMSQAFLQFPPKEPKTPKVSVGLVCSEITNPLLDCLESLLGQTYQNWELLLLLCPAHVPITSRLETVQPVENTPESFSESAVISLERRSARLEPELRDRVEALKPYLTNVRILEQDDDLSLGAAYNHLIQSSTGDYFLSFAPSHVALPDMIQNLVNAVNEANATVAISSQISLGKEPQVLNVPEGSLLKLMELQVERDICALYSKEFLDEFPYSEVWEIKALNMQLLAAAIATDQPIAYYPYPLYCSDKGLDPKSDTTINSMSRPKEQYYLRQYLAQIEPSKWARRQLNLLLSTIEQFVHEESRLNTEVYQLRQEAEFQRNSSQAWMYAAQEIQEELASLQKITF